MMSQRQVFLIGTDRIGWAIDEDFRQTKAALDGLVEFVGLDRCEIVHSVWWESLLELPRDALTGKRIICHLTGHPLRYLSTPSFRSALDIVGLWIARASQGALELDAFRIRNRTIFYTVDIDQFRPLPEQRAEFRTKWGLPHDRYLIGNFHRDSEGENLATPKLVKGPDIFAEIVIALHEKGLPIHAVLAGPRRHWLRGRLSTANVPFTFIGSASDDDDIRTNILPRSDLNELYNAIDLYLCSSRSESGPHSLLEAAASGCKVTSTPVGIAGDVLEAVALYRSPTEAIDLVSREISSGILNSTTNTHFNRVMRAHLPTIARNRYAELYTTIGDVPPCPAPPRRPEIPSRQRYVFDFGRLWHRLTASRVAVSRPKQRREPTVSIWHKFVPPPWGGGNQFLMALQRGLLERGFRLMNNRIDDAVDVYVLNSIHFDVDAFFAARQRRRLRILHRIDGPISLIRGFDREKDDLCFRLNRELAQATVLQSAWSYKRILELGYAPVSPIIVHNAADPAIFFPKPAGEASHNEKTRIISTSWSDNPRKGGPIYKWIDQHLDWTRYEYSFVGRASERFSNIRQIEPVGSKELAAILREHDIYITGSQNDPCSNALIEALSCGLPALYRDDGGHPELVSQGGLPFRSEEEILGYIDTIASNLEMFRRLITAPDFEGAIDKYCDIIRELARDG